MPFYQLITDVPENNLDEFVRSLRSLWIDFQRDKGCLNFSAYRGFEDEKSFFLVGEFDSHESMANHFKTQKFKVLIGATQVLSRSFKMIIAETKREGSYDLACPDRTVGEDSIGR